MEQHDDLSPLASPDEVGPDRFPDLGTLSPAFLYRSTPVPVTNPPRRSTSTCGRPTAGPFTASA